MNVNISKIGIYGAVIAGGRSQRMLGKNKLLLELGGEALINRAARKLQQQTDGVIVNINDDYNQLIDPDYDIVADEMGGNKGPLAGILSVLKWLETHQATISHDMSHLASVPADVPFFPDNIVAILNQTRKENFITVPFYDGHPQQLFSLWPVKSCQSLENFLLEATSRKVMDYIRSQNWQKIDVMKKKHNPFINVNTPDDWNKARTLFKRGL